MDYVPWRLTILLNCETIKIEKIFEKNEPFSRMVTLIYRCTETGKENMT